MARVMMATGACRFFTIRQDGYSLRFHVANLASQIWIDPDCRKETLEFFNAYLKEGDTAIDVGANIGDTTIVSSLKVGARGSVWAVEAHPRTFEFLKENLLLNGLSNVRAIHSAVGHSLGVLKFTDDRRDDMNHAGEGTLDVQVSPLDALVLHDSEVALLKIDVEGYEKFVLQGATSILERTACVYFEVSSIHFERFGYKTHEVLDILEESGFRLFRCLGPTEIAPIDCSFDTDKHENLIACRDLDVFLHRTGWLVISK